MELEPFFVPALQVVLNNSIQLDFETYVIVQKFTIDIKI